MHLEVATWDHYNALQDMVFKFVKHSPYVNMEVDEAKISDMLVDYIEHPVDRILLVAMDGEQPVGMIAGVANEVLFSRAKVASELMWWMEPEHRKSKLSFELLDAYVYWARKVGCQLVQMSTVETDQVERIQKVYSRKGFKLVERSFIKELH